MNFKAIIKSGCKHIASIIIAVIVIVVLVKSIEYILISVGKAERLVSYKGKTYSMHGDPFEIIRGATIDGKTIFEKATLSTWNNFRLVTDQEFKEYSEYSPRASEAHEAKEKQITSNRHLKSTANKLYLFSRENDSFQFIYSADDGLELKFQEIDGKLNLIGVDGDPVTPLHYSVDNEKNLFSILFWSFDDLRGKKIRALVFAKNPERETRLSKSFDSFVSGRELLALENKSVKLSFCSEVEKKEEERLRKSFDDWQLEIFGINLSVEKPDRFPPFSDVNINCVVLLRKYRPSAAFTLASVGFVPIALDRVGGKLIASDIFLDMNELEEEDGMYPTAAHELGHFLGLGHDFENVGSIMNYKDQVHVSKKDLEALAELYGIRSETSASFEPNYAGFYANTSFKNLVKILMLFGSTFLISFSLFLHRFPKYCSDKPPTLKLVLGILTVLITFSHVLLVIDYFNLR